MLPLFLYFYYICLLIKKRLQVKGGKRMIYQSNIIDIVKVKNGAPGQSGKTLYTWIAYSNADGIDNNGLLINSTDFSILDSSNRAYMGIASNKETLAESANPNDYKWSKIQGEQGPSGDGRGYFIELNTNEVKRFYEADGKVSFSTDLVYFYAHDENGNDIITNNSSNFEFKASLLSSFLETAEGIDFSSSLKDAKLQDLKENQEATALAADERIYKYFKVSELSSGPLPQIQKLDSFIFIQLYEKSTQPRLCASVIIPVSWALTEDYAKFWITAQTIQASVDGAGLSFGSDGLTISNNKLGGIKILRADYYQKTNDLEIIDGKKYYTLSSDNTYTEVILPTISDLVNYYELNDKKEVVFSADTLGNAYLKGNIEATSGQIGNIDIINGGLSCTKDGKLIFSLNEEGLIANSGTLVDLDLAGNLDITKSGSITGYKDAERKILGFKIDGNTGSIMANDIELGGSVSLSGYLRLGDNCWIFNPNAFNKYLNTNINKDSLWLPNSFINVNYTDYTYNKTSDTSVISGKEYFIKVNNEYIKVDSPQSSGLSEYYEVVSSALKTGVSITTDGYIKLRPEDSNGSIILDGKSSAIYSTNNANSSGYWRIDNNSATFNNIIARGSLKCAVLEYGEIQSVGGIVLIRPSSTIQSIVNIDLVSSVILQDASQFNVDDYCIIQISDNERYTIKIADKVGNRIDFFYYEDVTITPDLIGASVVDFGTREINGPSGMQENTSSYGISLNASSDEAFGLPGRALSLVNFGFDGNGIVSESRAILGHIPNNPEVYGAISDKYGLYADNVLVKGKLISDAGADGITSGIDSLSTTLGYPEHSKYFKNQGNIIFWAGAPDDNIQLSPFYVDSKGNMYAGSGYFDGAIITKSTIEAAEIRTAIITGNNQTDYALKIRNDGSAAKAIKFYEADEGNNEKVYFELTSQQMKIGRNTLLVVGDNTILSTDGVISNYFKTGSEEKSGSILSENQIGFLDQSLSGFSVSNDHSTLYLEHNGQNIKFFNDVITSLKRFSIGEEFDLWDKIEFKKIIENGGIVGFDIEFNS